MEENIRFTVKINDKDNVAIALSDLKKGQTIENNITVQTDIPQAHKVLLCDLKKDDAVIRYGVMLGTLKEDMKAGSWINEYSLNLPLRPSLENLPYATHLKDVNDLPMPKRTT